MKIFDKFRRDQSRLRLPTAIADGVVHGPGGTWAVVLIPARSTDNLNTTTILRMTTEGSSDLRRIIPPGAEFQGLILWGIWSGIDYLLEERRPGMRPETVEFIELGASTIDAKRYAKRMVLLAVRMDTAGSKAGSAVATATKVLGTTTVVRDGEAALANTMKKVNSFHERMRNSSFGARPATAQEISWALRRTLRRTVDWVPATNMVTDGQMMRLKATQILPHTDHLEMTTDTGTRYLRMVCPAQGGFPAVDMELPGGEWLKELNIVRQDGDEDDDETSPVEVCIRGRNVPGSEALKRLRDALKLTKEQERGARAGMAEEAPDAVAESHHVLRTRIREVEQGQVGMIEDAPVWIVEGKSLAQLDVRTRTLIDFYGSKGITLWAPEAIQDLLWMETVIGEGPRRVGEFTQFRPWPTLVGSWFHGGSEIGERRGPYLGGNIGSTPGPYRTRLSDAQLENETITTVFVGRSRSGKSTAVMLSVLGQVIVVDSWAALVDLKGDLKGIIAAARSYGVTVTEIVVEDQPDGSMCPFGYVDKVEKAVALAIGNLMLLLRPGSAELNERREALIRRAALEVGDREPHERSTWAIIETLSASDDEATRALGEDLKDLARSNLAGAVVGQPTNETTSLPTTPGLIYFGLESLDWPDEEASQEHWSPEERVSMLVAKAAMSYLTYMSDRVKGISKVVALTELHRMTRYSFGRSFIADLARTGAALDTNLLLDTQACVELVSIKGLIDQISQVHAFRAQSPAEADAQAILLGLEPEQAIRDTQHSWKHGECLTRDRQGRIAPVYFDYMSYELSQLLSTTPKRSQPNQPGVYDDEQETDVHASPLNDDWATDTDDDVEDIA